jgi:phage tail sheath protein FI
MSAYAFPIGPDPAAVGPPAEIGADGNPPAPADVVGIDNGPGGRTGLETLQDVEDVRIIAAPGDTSRVVQDALVTQAERLRYRFAVLDGETGPFPPAVVNRVLTHRNAYDTSFAGYYSPWFEVGIGDQRVLVPPSGHVAGIYARTDNARGVWKAPANEVVRGITGLELYFTTGEQDILNPRGVNLTRRFEGRGIRVWGARTLSSDPEYRYVNVRRFLIFMEASIDRGTQWVVFEPNAPETWARVVDSVSAFLHTQWRSGALLGRRPEDAFFVRCDETTMTADDIQNGRLICEIGVAIVRPAEFVIFRIEQITSFGTRV